MASTVWKGHLTFGLISVPIRLFAAARRESVSFNLLHKPCRSRIRQQTFCPACQRVVERDELVKGYEYERDKYVIVEAEELEKIAPESAHHMQILEFVKLGEVDPLYLDASYYAVPEEAGRKAYALLAETMEKAGYGALAKLAMHNREQLVLLRPRAGGLTLHTLYYASELHELPEYGRPPGVEVSPLERQLAERLIENLAAPFDPRKYRDEYQARLLELIQAKIEGAKPPEAEKPRLAPVIDLMEALQKSLAATAEKKPVGRAVAAEPREAKPARRKAARSEAG